MSELVVNGLRGTARQLRDFYAMDNGTSLHVLAAEKCDEAAARIEELEATLSDAVAYMKGDISGPAQKAGIIAEALRVLGKR